MRKFGALLAVNLKAMLTSFRFGGGRKGRQKAAGYGALFLLAFLALYISGTYSFLIAAQLAPLGLERLVVLLMSVLAVGMDVMFTTFAAQGVIFGGRDNDLMLSMPISAFSLMLSRTLALYAENLVFAVFVMVPAGVAYLVSGGEGGAAFFVVLLLGTLLLTLLPTLIALVVGFVIAWISSKFTRRGLLSTLLYVVAFLALMVLIMRLSVSMGDLAAYAMGMEAAFSGWGVPFLLLMEAACEGRILSLLALAALCILPFLLVVWLFGQRYKQIVTGLAAKGARSDYRLGKVSASGSRAALLKKEAKKFFGTPMYFLNAGVGLIMLVALSVAALFFRGTIEEVLRELADAGAEIPLFPLVLAAACFLIAMTQTTASSISLEGKQLWILKAAPIPVGSIFAVKVGFQMLLVVPCVLVSTVCLAIAFSFTAGEALVFLLAGVAVGLCMALLGLFVNLCMPKLDAPNDMVVVKQSGAVLVTMLACFILVLAAAGLYVLCQGALGAAAVFVPLALVLALCAALALLLATKGMQLFRAL